MHDAAPKAPPIAKKPGAMHEEEGGAKGHVELHHGPPPDGSMAHAKFHTIHHGGAGSGGGGGETKGHESLHAAHHAMNEHMGEDGCADSSDPEGVAAGAATDDEY